MLSRLSVTSLAAMLITATLLIFLYRQDQLAEHSQLASQENEKTLAHLMHTLGDQISAYVTEKERPDAPTMQASTDIGSLFAAALTAIHEDDALKLKIYNLAGIALYSSASNEIGGVSAHPDFVSRALSGETVHHVEHRDTFFGLKGEIHDVDVALTYMPLTHAGKRIGVIEIYDNATPVFKRLHTNSVRITLIVFGAFAMLYAALFYAALKVDRTIAKSRKALIESEQRWKFALEGAGDGVWDWSPETDVALYSRRWKEMLGYAEHEFPNLGAAWIEHIHPDDKDHVLSAMQACFAGEKPLCTAEFRMRCKNGSWKWILSRGRPANFDAEGKPLRIIGTNSDITERKKTEEQLRIAAATFETHDAILITDASSNIIRVNQAFTDITGYSQEEVLGKNPRILSSGHQEKGIYVSMWQQLKQAGKWSGEIMDKRKNGEIYPKWLTITAVKNERDETIRYVGIFNDITERKKAEEAIQHLAFYDVLTKLPNRRLFLDRFRAALTVSARYYNFGALLFIDLDRFKLLNDTLGHDYGDLLLIEVAARTKSCVREMDTVARLGGDEFVVLIEDVSYDQNEASYKVGLVAEKIRGALTNPYILNGHEHHCSPSIGVTLYHGNEKPMEDLLRHADIAMYQAKDAGRNTVRFFDPVLQQNMAAYASSLANDLRNAIALRQLHLYYQLQVDNDNRPVGAEALLRWIHPQRGMVMPDQFLPLAEESTLILDIGDWVLETASQQLVLWDKHERMRGLALAVNISAKQFAMPDFADKIAHVLQVHQIKPALLKLELTESMALDDIPGTAAKMRALKAFGISLSMGDFGNLYSSLCNLKLLPLDQIKLGRCFVRDMATDDNVALLMQSIIDFSSKYHITVIAEGVENEAQLNLLKNRDCAANQGFLISEVLSVEEFERLLNRT